MSKIQAFVPRQVFKYNTKLIWYPGNQSKALQQLQKGIGHVDLVVELRDARIPFSSANLSFEKILGERPRLIVFNKTDLSNQYDKKIITESFEKQGQKVLFTSYLSPKTIKPIIQYAIGTILCLFYI